MPKTHSLDADRGAAQVAPLLQALRLPVVRWAICVWLAACAASALASTSSAHEPAIAFDEPYFEFQSDTYGIGISLDPVFIDYLSADLTGDGQFRELLAYVGKPSSLWLGIGGWGTHRPSVPAQAELREEDGRTVLALRGIEFIGFLPTNTGQVAPVRADWVFEFHESFFDMTLTWQVMTDVAGLQEAGWALNMDVLWYGDSEDARRASRDVQGFPRWILWYGPDIGVVAAFREGSTHLAANRWYGNLESSYVIAHNWWKPGGSALDWGAYPGGTWRVGFFGGEQDIGAAERIYKSINSEDGQR
ncbi:MAG TPA: hypothetical protein DCL63_12640 [Firmicutes bacterium]|nr:hypothetical protein [Bacillota bacterium]